MTLALALARAGPGRPPDERAAAPPGPRPPDLAAPPAVLRRPGAVPAGHRAAAAGRFDRSARAHALGRPAGHHVRRRGHDPLLGRACCGAVAAARARPRAPPLYLLHRGHAVRAGGAGQGAGRPGPAGDHLRRLRRCSRGRWRRLRRPRSSPLAAAGRRCWWWRWWRSPGTTPCTSATAAPWWNELFGDNHWRRLMIGRHGDRGTFEYFLRELGYGAWPWVALAPAALAGRASGGRRPTRAGACCCAGRGLVRHRPTRWCRCR